MTKIEINFKLSENPTITSQEKGYNRYSGQFYTKDEVKQLKYEYAINIRRYMSVNKIETPRFKGAVRLTVIFGFSSSNRKNWGLLKTTKPDLDNAVKGLQDVLADLGFFEVGDQQVAELVVRKEWSDKPKVFIYLEELPYDIYRL